MINKKELLQFISEAENRYNIIAAIRGTFRNCYFSGADEDHLHFEGDEYWNYGGHEHHFGCMPWDYALCTEEKFLEYIERERDLAAVVSLSKEAEKLKKKELEELKLYAFLPIKPEGAMLDRYKELSEKYPDCSFTKKW